MSQLHPIISLLHPTARVRPSEGFPKGWRGAYDVWLERADHPENIEYVLSVHSSRWQDFCDLEHAEAEGGAFDEVNLSGRRFTRFLAVENKQRDCVVDQLNNCAANSSGKLLCGVQDDVVPPEHWDTLILEALGKGGPEQFSLYSQVRERAALDAELLLHFSSGSARDKDLIVAGALTRARYERYGYVLDPDFESMFADDWLTHQARQDEAAGILKIITRLDIEFTHNHPLFKEGARPEDLDEVYKLQNRPEAYFDGGITFKRKLGAKMITVGLLGQNFSSDYLFSWTKLYGHLLTAKGMLTNVFCLYTSNVHCTRMDFAQKTLESKYKPDYVLSIDDDNTLSPEYFDLLQKDLDEDPELDGVLGWCWCDPADAMGDKDDVKAGGQIPYVASCGVQKGWNPDRTENGEGIKARAFTIPGFEDHFQKTGRYVIHSGDLFPNAFWSGLPVILMRYEALKRLGPEAFQPMLKPEVKFGFTSEDTTFFYRAHQAGMKFGVDMRVKVPHLKLRAIEVQYLPGVKREDVLKAQGKALGVREEVPV